MQNLMEVVAILCVSICILGSLIFVLYFIALVSELRQTQRRVKAIMDRLNLTETDEEPVANLKEKKE